MPITNSTTPETPARLHFRLPAEVKETIERAAVVAGLTVTDFAISALLSSAHEILDRQQTRTLSDRDRDRFLSLLDAENEPNAALIEAADAHRRLIRK